MFSEINFMILGNLLAQRFGHTSYLLGMYLFSGQEG